MKFVIFAVGIAILATAAGNDYAKDYKKYYEKYLPTTKAPTDDKGGSHKGGSQEGGSESDGKDYAKEYEKYYEKYWKPDKDQDKDQDKDWAKEYEKYWKKDWGKEYGYVDAEDANEYLDETYAALRTDARALSLDPIHLPDNQFKLRVESQGARVVYRVHLANQVLTGFSSVKKVGEGNIQKYYGEPKLGSVFQAKDLEINGVLSVLGGGLNKTCTLFVDIEELTGRVELGLQKNVSDPLTVASLRVFAPEKPYLELQKDCVDDRTVLEELVTKFKDTLKDDLTTSIRKPLKEALTKTLKPFQGKQ